MKYITLLALMITLGCAGTKKNSEPATTDKPAEKAAAAPPAAKIINNDEIKLFCSKQKEQRVLEVLKKDNGCVLNYTKSGKTNATATSTSGTKHCSDSMSKIRLKLEKSGFHCS